MSHSQVISHGNHGNIVHRPCSSCISSIGNLTGTLSSSPCQLRLGVVLRSLILSPYTYHMITTYCFIYRSAIVLEIEIT